MKIATFNINNINKRLDNLLGWLHQARPDVACLQELKASDSQFPAASIEKAGYGAVWSGERSWNGVAILARGSEPVVTNIALPGDSNDTQSRYIEAAVGGVLIGTLYAPNGNPQPGPKFKYKLQWMERLLAHAAELRYRPIAEAGHSFLGPLVGEMCFTHVELALDPPPRFIVQPSAAIELINLLPLGGEQ